MDGTPLALDGLRSRGGFSNWVAFFFPREIVMCDLGMGPAFKQGAMAGLSSQLGPMFGSGGATPAGDPWKWCAELESKAKTVEHIDDARVRGVRLHLRMLGHQLLLSVGEEKPRRFNLVYRAQSEAAADPLRRGYGDRFEVTSTGAYRFFKRYLPFLAQ